MTGRLSPVKYIEELQLEAFQYLLDHAAIYRESWINIYLSHYLKLTLAKKTDKSSRENYNSYATAILKRMKIYGIKNNNIDKNKIVGTFEKWENKNHSRYETLMTYGALVRMLEKIKNVAKKRNMLIKDFPTIGSLPYGSADAMAIQVPESSKYVIIFNIGIFGFIRVIEHIIVQAYSFKVGNTIEFSFNREIIIKTINESPILQKQFKNFLNACILQGNPYQTPYFRIKTPQLELARYLDECSKLFIMAHEYAHILRGHLDYPAFQQVSIGYSEFNVAKFNHQLELEADKIGLLLLNQIAYDGGYLNTALAGIELYFSAAELIDKAFATLEYGDDTPIESITHPSFAVRRLTIKKVLPKIISNKQLIVQELLFADAVKLVIDTLWQKTKNDYMNYHKKGIKPGLIFLKNL